MRNEPITLHGAFHGSNFGDLLLLQMQLSWLADAGHTNVCVPTWNESIRKMINVPDGLEITKCTSATIIFGGGGYFGAPQRAKTKWVLNWTRHHAVVLTKAAFSAKNVSLIGTGVGPLPPFPFGYLIKRALRRADVIQPRDEESKEYLQRVVRARTNNAIEVGTDLAVWMAGSPSFVPSHGGATKVVGIHLAPPLDDVAEFDVFLEKIGKILASYGYRIRVLIDQQGTNGAKRQRKCGLKVAHGYGIAVEEVCFETVDQFVIGIAECDSVITSKLHVGVVARCYGVPVFSVPTHVKTIRFYRQIGEEARCKPWGQQPMSKLVEDINEFLQCSNARTALAESVVERGKQMRSLFSRIATTERA